MRSLTARLHKQTPQHAPSPTLAVLRERWIESLHSIVPGSLSDHTEHCDDLLAALAAGPDQVTHALRRFGSTFGSYGWTLADVTAWVDQLANLGGELTQPLQGFRAGVALAEGWAAGTQYGLRQRETYDPLTGVATLAVLRLRLNQIVAQCRSLAVPPEQVYCLVVLDVDVSELYGLERDATLVMVAERLQRRFQAGETIAYAGGRFLVLASHTEATRTAVLDLIADIRLVPFVAHQRVFGWIEDLPASLANLNADATVIDGYLLELTA